MALYELVNVIDIKKLTQEPHGPERCVKMMKLLASIIDKDLPTPISLEPKDLIHQWSSVKKQLAIEITRHPEKTFTLNNPLDDKRCERLLKNRDDIELRKLVKQDILAALKSDTLPASMRRIFPYDFIVKILQKNRSYDDSVRLVLEEFCMRPGVYEDFVVYSFQILGHKELPLGIAAAVDLMKNFNEDCESYATSSP